MLLKLVVLTGSHHKSLLENIEKVHWSGTSDTYDDDLYIITCVMNKVLSVTVLTFWLMLAMPAVVVVILHLETQKSIAAAYRQLISTDAFSPLLHGIH